MKGTWLDFAIWSIWQLFSKIPPAITSAVIGGVVAWLVSNYNYRRNIRPVLIFTKRNQSFWHLENVGSGPAINVLVSDAKTDCKWKSPTRYHSIGVKDRAQLLPPPSSDSLAVRYSDINHRWYSTECIDSKTTIHATDTFNDWGPPVFTEHDLMAQRNGAMDISKVFVRSADRDEK